MAVFEKDLNFSIQKTYDLYCYLLLLIMDVKKYAENRIDLAKNKILPTEEDLHPNTRFVENRVISSIAESADLKSYLKKQKISWINHPELIRYIYDNLIQSSYFQDYMSAQEDDYLTDKQFVLKFYSKEIEDNELLYQTLEEQSIFWNDDIEFVISMIIKTIKLQQEGEPVKLLDLYKSDEDKVFASSLFKKVILMADRNRSLIEKHTRNWDFERLAFMDMIIMQTAISEMVEFPSIPINVTLNEYIDIAKFYSTPKSGHFINGILDKISTELKNDGSIVKRGRGLKEG
ncbi:MAG: transcription antitermination factor NusB [Bacteroidales bacterium]|nr:transcription antitermination factor NusB [Bacteroidales bacterium]